MCQGEFDMGKGCRTGKMGKALSLLLVIPLLGSSQDLIAGERHGAMLTVQKKDGHQENGELIAVKPSSLLLLDSASGADLSIEVSEISTIRIIKKSKVWAGLGWGALAGAALGAVIGLISYGGGDVWFDSAGEKAFFAGAFFAIPAGLLGLVIGAAKGADERISFEGKNDLQIQSALRGLRYIARIPDFK